MTAFNFFFDKSSSYLIVVSCVHSERKEREYAETVSRRYYNLWNFALVFIMIFSLHVLSWFSNLVKLKFSLSKFSLF